MYAPFQKNSNSHRIKAMPMQNKQVCKNQHAEFDDNRSTTLQNQRTIQLMVISNRYNNVIQCAENGIYFKRFRHAVSTILGAAVWGAISAVTTVCFEKGDYSKGMLTSAWQGALSNSGGAIGGIFIGFIINKLLECLGNCCKSKDREHGTDINATI